MHCIRYHFLASSFLHLSGNVSYFESLSNLVQNRENLLIVLFDNFLAGNIDDVDVVSDDVIYLLGNVAFVGISLLLIMHMVSNITYMVVSNLIESEK